MAIVINEIEIAVEITSGNNAQDGTSSTGDLSQKEAIVRECIEKVMEIIHLKNER